MTTTQQRAATPIAPTGSAPPPAAKSTTKAQQPEPVRVAAGSAVAIIALILLTGSMFAIGGLKATFGPTWGPIVYLILAAALVTGCVLLIRSRVRSKVRRNRSGAGPRGSNSGSAGRGGALGRLFRPSSRRNGGSPAGAGGKARPAAGKRGPLDRLRSKLPAKFPGSTKGKAAGNGKADGSDTGHWWSRTPAQRKAREKEKERKRIEKGRAADEAKKAEAEAASAREKAEKKAADSEKVIPPASADRRPSPQPRQETTAGSSTNNNGGRPMSGRGRDTEIGAGVGNDADPYSFYKWMTTGMPRAAESAVTARAEVRKVVRRARDEFRMKPKVMDVLDEIALLMGLAESMASELPKLARAMHPDDIAAVEQPTGGSAAAEETRDVTAYREGSGR